MSMVLGAQAMTHVVLWSNKKPTAWKKTIQCMISPTILPTHRHASKHFSVTTVLLFVIARLWRVLQVVTQLDLHQHSLLLLYRHSLRFCQKVINI